MSYGSDLADAYRRVGICAARLLKGEAPRDLPVMQATKVAFVVNAGASKVLGLAIPSTLLALADEVIE
jgi:putative ABC transport system substrate-binding protein